ncbi:MAG: hypothetical protein RBU37_12535, partial [Myxococcota bacterium]|nr:hypothetical protein [Myxococcota bacterium]
MDELEHGPTPGVTEQPLAAVVASREDLGSKRPAKIALSQRLWTASLTFLLRLVLCACPVFFVLFSKQRDGDLLTTQSIWLFSGGLAALGILFYEGLAFWRGVKSFPQEWL